MGRNRKLRSHDGLIVLNAHRAAYEGADETSCPYVYDLRAKKIWLKAFKEWKRNERKTDSKD